MYSKTFAATDDADWAVSIELFDDDTGAELAEAADADFNVEVSLNGSSVLSASTDDATITKPEDHIVQWVFTAAQMNGLCPGTTYTVGLTMTTITGKTQLLVGSLAVIDGGF
jgi:hypothetical protein